MEHGFMYLAAVIDVHSRMVLSRDISNTMEASWCKDIVSVAIAKYGTPEIFNTDQGSQFTSFDFYNTKRGHQSIDYKCPLEIFKNYCQFVA